MLLTRLIFGSLVTQASPFFPFPSTQTNHVRGGRQGYINRSYVAALDGHPGHGFTVFLASKGKGKNYGQQPTSSRR
jgi:hypothetical protein